jgi:hypothetical protein
MPDPGSAPSVVVGIDGSQAANQAAVWGTAESAFARHKGDVEYSVLTVRGNHR